MSDEKESAADFLQRVGVDARLWAEEFLRLKPDATDFATMVGWFANAIMAGVDSGSTRVVKQAAIIRVMREAIQRVHDDEETGAWGPDTTMKAVLATALAEADRLAGGK